MTEVGDVHFTDSNIKSPEIKWYAQGADKKWQRQDLNCHISKSSQFAITAFSYKATQLSAPRMD